MVGLHFTRGPVRRSSDSPAAPELRTLLHLHLQKLEEAGLVASQLELSSDGKALNYFEVADFLIELSPAAIAQAAASLTNPTDN